jgi:hypothetical protein
MKLEKLGMVLLISLTLQSAKASSHDEDLKWFKSVLQFSEMSQKNLEQFFNPFEGAQQFRLSEKNAPWAGNYFPMESGGIASRWRTNEYPAEVLDKSAVEAMTEKQLRNLSPVEKYDIMMGFYDFRTTQHELKMRGPQREVKPKSWEGFCNGVRCAGIMTKEPYFPVTFKNKDGISVVFSPADLKALAGASYFYVEKYGQIGGPSIEKGRAQNQPNAAVFFLSLRFQLAEKKKGFVIDSHLGAEIWNETVVGYSRTFGEIQKINAAEKTLYPKAHKKVYVSVVLETLGEVDIHDSNQQTKARVADGSMLTTLETAYTLYLNKSGEAIDGKWHNTGGDRGVDFAWFVSGKGADHEYADRGGTPNLRCSRIRKLFKQSALTCSNLFL